MSDEDQCGGVQNEDAFLNLRVASVFVVLVTSTFGACFPLWAKDRRIIPSGVFQYVYPRYPFSDRSLTHQPPVAFITRFAKYFGSGVIVRGRSRVSFHEASQLCAPDCDRIHPPPLSRLRSARLAMPPRRVDRIREFFSRLHSGWALTPWHLRPQPWPSAISMAAVFFLFFAELIAFRWGTAKLARLGANYDAHGHGHGYTAHGPEGAKDPTPAATTQAKSPPSSDVESQAQVEVHHTHTHTHESSPLAQIIAVVILEFGVIFHSVIIGLTLAVDQAFKVLFIVIVFHQMFEGLGLGTRLAALKLPASHKWTPLIGAIVYGLTTPIGIAAGLGVRYTYNPNSTTALIVSGVFDSFSSGILLYTGLVELLAHEFIFNKEMIEAPIGQVAYAAGSVVLGAGIMALLGRWA